MALVSTFANLPSQVAVLGSLVSILAGLFVSYLEQEDQREERFNQTLAQLKAPLSLAPDHALFDYYSNFSSSLVELSKKSDPLFREFTHLKLASISEQLNSLSTGRIVFEGTETWRTIYEDLLQSPEVKTYYSVSWVKTKDYWQDPPGLKSMEENFNFKKSGRTIERVVVLTEELWPTHQKLPRSSIYPWIEDQHERGLSILLARENDVASEPYLIGDFGIYGNRATGVHELNDRSETMRFILEFDEQSIRLALNRYERLYLYATPLSKILSP